MQQVSRHASRVTLPATVATSPPPPTPPPRCAGTCAARARRSTATSTACSSARAARPRHQPHAAGEPARVTRHAPRHCCHLAAAADPAAALRGDVRRARAPLDRDINRMQQVSRHASRVTLPATVATSPPPPTPPPRCAGTCAARARRSTATSTACSR
ncbi:unnamed protein product [Euphydryas editha]|uniref:Uncharacterized protein n=1 Tax=Euphydryas editha TaxID=104508 RepID=A0AAU9U3X3_EUPED|nr:unnamed protein product [Euphydryas editha]